ncbi:5-carboxymethyl-2-hydroxymuconate Delta-isomerase [Chitinimonas sp.]|uniref:5-carboxymethyl-2-hydroxymuconate Delta-isomerase n=1 Tax=Chitinimonas sp. TaxID=1934313 RepID=UPI002F92FD9C
MPHLVLEYTDNLPDQPDFKQLFSELHTALTGLEGIKLADIKSRAIRLSDWLVGDGASSHAFVHLKLHLIDSRTDAFKQRALAVLQPVLARHYARSLAERDCQLCFEVIDIRGAFYAKTVSPSLN